MEFHETKLQIQNQHFLSENHFLPSWLPPSKIVFRVFHLFENFKKVEDPEINLGWRKWFSERKCWFWICCLVSWNCMEELLWRYCQMICEYFLALHHTSIISFRGKLSYISVLTCHWAGPSNVVWLFITCFFLIRKLVILLDFLENSSKFQYYNVIYTSLILP